MFDHFYVAIPHMFKTLKVVSETYLQAPSFGKIYSEEYMLLLRERGNQSHEDISRFRFFRIKLQLRCLTGF